MQEGFRRLTVAGWLEVLRLPHAVPLPQPAVATDLPCVHEQVHERLGPSDVGNHQVISRKGGDSQTLRRLRPSKSQSPRWRFQPWSSGPRSAMRRAVDAPTHSPLGRHSQRSLTLTLTLMLAAPEELYLMDLVEAGQAAGRASLNLIQQVRAKGAGIHGVESRTAMESRDGLAQWMRKSSIDALQQNPAVFDPFGPGATSKHLPTNPPTPGPNFSVGITRNGRTPFRFKVDSRNSECPMPCNNSPIQSCGGKAVVTNVFLLQALSFLVPLLTELVPKNRLPRSSAALPPFPSVPCVPTSCPSCLLQDADEAPERGRRRHLEPGNGRRPRCAWRFSGPSFLHGPSSSSSASSSSSSSSSLSLSISLALPASFFLSFSLALCLSLLPAGECLRRFQAPAWRWWRRPGLLGPCTRRTRRTRSSRARLTLCSEPWGLRQVVRDGCVDLVLQFVHTNFQNPDWKLLGTDSSGVTWQYVLSQLFH